jgi:hypothetical protein
MSFDLNALLNSIGPLRHRVAARAPRSASCARRFASRRVTIRRREAAMNLITKMFLRNHMFIAEAGRPITQCTHE